MSDSALPPERSQFPAHYFDDEPKTAAGPRPAGSAFYTLVNFFVVALVCEAIAVVDIVIENQVHLWDYVPLAVASPLMVIALIGWGVRLGVMAAHQDEQRRRA